MFSFFTANKSPSNSNLSSHTQPDVEEPKSSFSFMGGGGGGEPAAPEPPVEPGSGKFLIRPDEASKVGCSHLRYCVSSGFSFMASAAPEPVHDGDSSQANGSGFSFLSSPQTEAPSESASSFSFMSHPPAHEEPVCSIHSLEALCRFF